MYTLIESPDSTPTFLTIYAIDSQGRFCGQLVNSSGGGLHANPETESAGVFARVFDGHGLVIHLLDSPSPYGVTAWSEAFRNFHLIPEGTQHIFLDGSFNCEAQFRKDATNHAG